MSAAAAAATTERGGTADGNTDGSPQGDRAAPERLARPRPNGDLRLGVGERTYAGRGRDRPLPRDDQASAGGAGRSRPPQAARAVHHADPGRISAGPPTSAGSGRHRAG